MLCGDFLIEKQSKLWNDTRISNKENRLKETDVIKLHAEYAKEQGSTHSDKLYLTYTKLGLSISEVQAAIMICRALRAARSLY